MDQVWRWICISITTYIVYILWYLDFMLRLRSVFVDIRGVRVHMSVWRSKLSPLLWNMVVDSLPNRLGNCNCFVQGFADDVVIIISGKFLRIICDLMQRTLNCVHNWCGEIWLKMSMQIRHLWYFSQKGGILRGFSPHDSLTRNWYWTIR
jgi:hypothetical protein